MVSSSNLIKFFELRSIKYDDVKLKTWQEFFRDYDDNLVQEGLVEVIEDTSIINPNAGDVLEKMRRLTNNNQEQLIEKAWQECLASAKSGGDKLISARSAKALNSLGGMMWLRNSDPNKNNWNRETFIDIYKNTPDPGGLDFNCYGQLSTMIYTENNQKLLE